MVRARRLPNSISIIHHPIQGNLLDSYPHLGSLGARDFLIRINLLRQNMRDSRNVWVAEIDMDAKQL